jgi:hypothetical protein
MTGEAPGGAAMVLEVLEGQRQEVRQWMLAGIKSLEDQCDDELRRLDRAAAVLGGVSPRPAAKPGQEETPRPRSRTKRRSRRKRAGSAQAIHERCEAVFRFLDEQQEPRAKGEIRGALRMSDFGATSALDRLMEDGRVRRKGIGSGTRYEAKRRASTSRPSGLGALREGTVQGKALAIIRDRGRASSAELAQALRVTPELIQRECAALIVEEEIRMDRYEGKTVYVYVGEA